MAVVGTGAHAIGKELTPYIDEQQLPRKYGGQADGW
jgi:phosphatidylinositol transfer protein SFH5